MKVIMITPNSAIKEIDHEEFDNIRGSTLYAATQKYNLTVLMKDLFTEGDAINTLATTLYNKLLIQGYEHNM